MARGDGNAARILPDLPRAAQVSRPPGEAAWSLAEVAGRVAEVSALGASASLTAVAVLVRDAQRQGETVAWVSGQGSLFFPPDMAAWGVDLEALAVVRLASAGPALAAADELLRSGAFGLVILDLGPGDGPMAAWARLAGLAQRQDAALVVLTDKDPGTPSLGSFVSLRLDARPGDPGFRLTVRKDKRRGPGFRHEGVCHGPAGLC
ncbi:recombinase A [Myxococcota bacterium]|nr:recombinase A [Myxococcota bacterium]